MSKFITKMNSSIIILDEKTLCDLECLLGGYFEPLDNFMNSANYKSVCENLHLISGDFFPLPITLAIDKKVIDIDKSYDLILCDSTNYPLANLVVNEYYEPDIDWECQNSLGTNDVNHPYVKYKDSHRDKYYVSGILTKINDIRHYDFSDIRTKPESIRKSFIGQTVLGFQTRNPMHKAHYELTKYGLKKTGKEDAVLFLNPVVGETQSIDIDYHIRVNCYKELLNEYDQNTHVVLSLLPLAMRMAGPREACLHALIRRNYGCTHFVVGRDHAGPSYKTKNGESFYGPYEAQELFVKYSQEIGIKPVFSKMIVYNKTDKIYQPIDEIGSSCEIGKLSGTDFRHMLKNNIEIPDWFSFPNIIDILKKSVKKRGTCYYFIGLSGSGKTTYANILKQKILEKDPSKEITILDGDIVRQELSKGLGFSKEDRSINVRRIGYLASEIVKHGGTVICANIAPYDDDRLHNRKKIEQLNGTYIEIFVNTPLDVCEKRDIKGLYKLARQGIIKQFTGISDPFELPSKPDITININDIQNEIFSQLF